MESDCLGARLDFNAEAGVRFMCCFHVVDVHGIRVSTEKPTNRMGRFVLDLVDAQPKVGFREVVLEVFVVREQGAVDVVGKPDLHPGGLTLFDEAAVAVHLKLAAAFQVVRVFLQLERTAPREEQRFGIESPD